MYFGLILVCAVVGGWLMFSLAALSLPPCAGSPPAPRGSILVWLVWPVDGSSRVILAYPALERFLVFVLFPRRGVPSAEATPPF